MSVTDDRGRRLWTVASALVLSSSATSLASDVSRRLDELANRREKINWLHMQSTTTVRMGSGNRESNIETWEKRADGKVLWRREIRTKVVASADAEPVESRTLMVSDGTTAWREMPVVGSRKIVFKGTSRPQDDFADIRAMVERGEARVRDADPILDQLCVCIEVKGKEGNELFLATWWISERHGIVLRSIVEGSDQSVTETRVTRLTVDEPVEPMLFSYKPPGDAQIIDSDKLGGGRTKHREDQ